MTEWDWVPLLLFVYFLLLIIVIMLKLHSSTKVTIKLTDNFKIVKPDTEGNQELTLMGAMQV